MKNTSSDQDLADKALAEEFADYISEVASQILEPVKAYEARIGQASRQIQESVAQVAEGHEETRRKLIALLEEHRGAARKETQEHAARIKSELEPKLAELTRPLSGLVENLNAQNVDSTARLYSKLIAHVDKAVAQVTLINENALRHATEEAASEQADRKRLAILLCLSAIMQGVIAVLVVFVLLK